MKPLDVSAYVVNRDAVKPLQKEDWNLSLIEETNAEMTSHDADFSSPADLNNSTDSDESSFKHCVPERESRSENFGLRNSPFKLVYDDSFSTIASLRKDANRKNFSPAQACLIW